MAYRNARRCRPQRHPYSWAGRIQAFGRWNSWTSTVANGRTPQVVCTIGCAVPGPMTICGQMTPNGTGPAINDRLTMTAVMPQ